MRRDKDGINKRFVRKGLRAFFCRFLQEKTETKYQLCVRNDQNCEDDTSPVALDLKGSERFGRVSIANSLGQVWISVLGMSLQLETVAKLL